MNDTTISGGDYSISGGGFKYEPTTPGNFTFEPTILKEVKALMLDEEYTLPAIDHPQACALTSLFAVVIQLHKRVEALEAELKQHKGGDT